MFKVSKCYKMNDNVEMVLPCCWCVSGLGSCRSSGENHGETPPLDMRRMSSIRWVRSACDSSPSDEL